LQVVEDPWAAVEEPLFTSLSKPLRADRRRQEYEAARSYLPLVVALAFMLVVALSGLVLLRRGVGPFSIASASTAGHAATATRAPAARPTATRVPPTRMPVPTATATATATATPLPTNWAQFVKMDAKTQGSWMDVYGAQGADVFENGATLPATIAVTPNGAAKCSTSTGCWAGQTADLRALEKVTDPSNAKDRIAACWYSGASFSIDVNITDGQTHQMALYALDWDGYGQGRTETISLYDVPPGGGDGTQLDTRTISQFQGGVYLVWRVRGHVRIVVTNTNSASNAVASGLFFDAG
jgi:hypothetical protein